MYFILTTLSKNYSCRERSGLPALNALSVQKLFWVSPAFRNKNVRKTKNMARHKEFSYNGEIARIFKFTSYLFRK